MALISFQQVTLGFGGPKLLQEIDLQIERGERVGLLGRNGMGKSTLLKLITGDLQPDSGAITRQQNLKTAYLPQEVPVGLAGTIAHVVAGGLDDPDALLPHEAESWQQQMLVDKILNRMQLDGGADFGLLSAGMKRRVLLARGLVKEPDLLLLDEPTNHLDIDAINWLEDFLARWDGTLVFVTHDRAFLQRLSTRIVELDRGYLIDWNFSYSAYLRRKEAALSAEADQNSEFDKKLAQEEAWIRRGIEARRTRNEGRVRALKKLREVRRERREQPAKVKMQIQEARRSGTLVIEAEHLGFAYGDRPLVRDFSTIIQRGDKVGIIGPNGSGKTTLIRLLLGELEAQAGTVEHGTNLAVAYFDQLRAQLDDNKSVLDNVVVNGGDMVTVNGRTRHVISYLEDFLFPKDLINSPILSLSGGERNRLLLARLFTHPANLLVMDEPTNDLDLETLELLEDMLLDYSGTLIMVSHDREFLNNLVTSVMVMDGSGQVKEYVGGYDDWLRQSRAEAQARAEDTEQAEAQAKSATRRSIERDDEPAAPRRLSYKEQKALEAQKHELGELPARIDALETEQGELTRAMADPAFYQQDAAEIARAAARMKEIEEELSRALARWEELEHLLQ